MATDFGKCLLSATVIHRREESDLVLLRTGLPSPIPKVSSAKLVVFFTAERGTGVEYVRQNFAIEPEVIQS